MAYRWVKSSW